MSRMADLAWDIEQLWIEGMSPVQIADQLDCHVQLVEDWIADVGMVSDVDMEDELEYDLPPHSD